MISLQCHNLYMLKLEIGAMRRFHPFVNLKNRTVISIREISPLKIMRLVPDSRELEDLVHIMNLKTWWKKNLIPNWCWLKIRWQTTRPNSNMRNTTNRNYLRKNKPKRSKGVGIGAFQNIIINMDKLKGAHLGRLPCRLFRLQSRREWYWKVLMGCQRSMNSLLRVPTWLNPKLRWSETSRGIIEQQCKTKRYLRLSRRRLQINMQRQLDNS